MKKLNIALTLLVAILLGGCTHNNGDIGDLFGQWAVDEVTIDGVYDANYPYGDVYFLFQNNIVKVNVFDGIKHDEADMYAATWHRVDGGIIMDFNQRNDGGSYGDLPAFMHITPNAPTIFKVLDESSSTLVLSFPGTTLQTVTYRLRKLR